MFDEEEHGLTEEVLANTDVLVFWNHMLQEEFSDDVAERVRRHVLAGMGLVVLHSGHYSKIMRKLLGTSMTLRWRHGDRERLFCTCPTHPIAQGIPAWVDIPEEEMYGEFFDIPKPDDVVFTGWFAGGEVFRSGCTFTRGLGKIFYFQPGHEEYPIYHMPVIQQIIKNAPHMPPVGHDYHRLLRLRQHRLQPRRAQILAVFAQRLIQQHADVAWLGIDGQIARRRL